MNITTDPTYSTASYPHRVPEKDKVAEEKKRSESAINRMRFFKWSMSNGAPVNR